LHHPDFGNVAWGQTAIDIDTATRPEKKRSCPKQQHGTEERDDSGDKLTSHDIPVNEEGLRPPKMGGERGLNAQTSVRT
jgi:hypothetical protein